MMEIMSDEWFNLLIDEQILLARTVLWSGHENTGQKMNNIKVMSSRMTRFKG